MSETDVARIALLFGPFLIAHFLGGWLFIPAVATSLYLYARFFQGCEVIVLKKPDVPYKVEPAKTDEEGKTDQPQQLG